MNYKVMKRPMFRLGGSARKDFNTGGLGEIEELINKRAALRDKAYSSMGSMLPFQVLAGQRDDIRTIRSLGDVTKILSNLGTDPSTFEALGKLGQIDLKKTEGQLTDKITLAKLRSSQNKKYEFERRLARANQLKGELSNYVTEQQGLGKTDEEIRSSGRFQSLNRDIDYLLRETSLKDFLYQARLKDGEDFDIKQATKEYYDIGKVQQEFKADGGRIGYQEGTPNPDMVMPQPKPEEAMNDRRVDTLMKAAPAMEDPNEARSMGDQDMYKSLRRRLPPEITDDVVRLIAYNREAFTDFANISDQSDVQSFNQKYNVELVLPVGNQ